MAQGGGASLDTLRDLADMPITYTGARRQRNPQQEILTVREMEMQENVFKDPFAIPPGRMDFSYPTSIQNISLNLDNFPIDALLGETVKGPNLNHPFIDSQITSEIIKHDFGVFKKPLQADDDKEAGAVGGPDYSIQRFEIHRPLFNLIGKNAKLNSIYFSTTALRFFGETEHACRPAMSLRVLGEAAPITIIAGEDDILDAGVVNEPQTIRHTYVYEDVCRDMRLYKEIKLSEGFKQCKVRYHILYYWYHDLIKGGCVYWMATDGENYILHDLTSTFKMTPFESSSQTAFDELENRAIWNACGLLYYNSVLYRWQNNIITPELRERAFELCKRATQMINNKEFPMEWCLANIIYSDICVPLNVDLNAMMLYIPRNRPNGTIEYNLSNVLLCMDMDAYNKTKKVLQDSMIHLRESLDFLINELYAVGRIPYVTGTTPYGSRKLNFNLEELAKGLVKINVREMKQISLIDILNGFVAVNDTPVLVTAYALRKLYVDCVVQARFYQRYDNLNSMAMFSEYALAAWIMMTSTLGEGRMPLPLRPVYMLGDLCYRLSIDPDRAITLFNSYRPATEQEFIRNLVPITVAYDINRVLGLIKRDKRHFYLRDSFECYARAILYSEVIPDQDLLQRICVVANDLVFSLLELSDENNDQYTGETNAKRNLSHCKLLLDVVFNLVVQFTDERRLLVNACVLKSRFLRICMQQQLKRGAIGQDYISFVFEKIEELQDRAFVVCDQFDIEIPIIKNLVTMECTVSLTDYIFRLRYREDQDKVSYHQDIILSYVRYVDFCRSRFADKDHGQYFKFRAAVGYASLAEYLFGLYKEEKNDKIKDEAELWFEEADVCFSQLHRYSAMEMIKTRNDRLAFYDFMTTGQNGALVYDFKTITILLKSLELLDTISETEYKEYSGCVLTDSRRVRMIGVLIVLVKRLQKAIQRRIIFYKKATNNIIDIPRDKILNLFRMSLNPTQMDMLQNLKSVLEEIRKLKSNTFRLE